MIKPKAIHLLVPCTYKDEVEEKARIDNFNTWFDEFTDYIIEKFEIVPHPYIAYTGSDLESREFEIRFKGATNKGLWVRSSLLTISTKYEYSDLKDIFLLFVDGSGKIPFHQINSVLDALLRGYPIALGCRLDNNWTDDKNRLTAEEYEKYVIERKYNIRLPDAQCGCWGLNCHTLKDISLISNSYEIELDLLINSIENDYNICFIPIETKEGKSAYNEEANTRKLNYLAYKLDLTKEELLKTYESFKKETNQKLPDTYTENIQKINNQMFNHKGVSITCLQKQEAEKCNKCEIK